MGFSLVFFVVEGRVYGELPFLDGIPELELMREFRVEVKVSFKNIPVVIQVE